MFLENADKWQGSFASAISFSGSSALETLEPGPLIAGCQKKAPMTSTMIHPDCS